jgi:hypothetical protein
MVVTSNELKERKQHTGKKYVANILHLKKL